MKPHIKKVNNLWQCVTRGSMQEWSIGASPKDAYNSWLTKKEAVRELKAIKASINSSRIRIYKGA